jgi:hypothetical protein
MIDDIRTDFEQGAAVIRTQHLEGGTVELIPGFADPGDLRDFRAAVGIEPDKEGCFVLDAGRAREVSDRLIEAGFLVL